MTLNMHFSFLFPEGSVAVYTTFVVEPRKNGLLLGVAVNILSGHSSYEPQLSEYSGSSQITRVSFLSVFFMIFGGGHFSIFGGWLSKRDK